MKQIKLMCLTILIILLGIFTISCNDDSDNGEIFKSLKIESSEYGTINATPNEGHIGDFTTIIVSPHEGYEVDSIKHDGQELTIKDNKATTVFRDSDNIISASFKKSTNTEPEPIEYSVTIGNFDGGHVSAIPNKGPIGTEITLYVSPKNGYSINSLSYDGIMLEVKDNIAHAIITNSTNVVNASFIKNENGNDISYLNQYSAWADENKIYVNLNQVGGIFGTAKLIMVKPNEYYQYDTNIGVSKNKVEISNTTIVGEYKCGTNQTFTIDRYTNSYDNLYSKFYVIKDSAITVGPFYVSDVTPIRENIKYNKNKSIKGIFTEDTTTNLSYYEDLDANATSFNITINNLIMPNEYYDEKNQLVIIDNSSDSSAYSFEVNGKTYYFRKSYVDELDNKIKTYTDVGANITAILLAQQNYDSTYYPESLRYFDEENQTPGTYFAFNTSNELGMQYFAATMEFLAERYSRPSSEHGYIENFVLGNELDFWKDYNAILANSEKASLNDYIEELSRTARIAYLACSKYSNGITITLPFTHWFAKPGIDSTSPYVVKDLLEQFNLVNKSQGNYNWAIAPHCYGASLAQSNYLNFDTLIGKTDSQYAMTGDLNTGLISYSNVELWQMFLEQEHMLYNGQTRHLYITEAGNSSQEDTDEMRADQAAMLALAYYKVTSMPCVKQYIYYRLIDHEAETSGFLACGILDTNGNKKPAYDVLKYIDTQYSLDIANQYVDRLIYGSNKANGYEEALNIFNTDYDWNYHWNYSYNAVTNIIDEEIYFDDLIDLSAYEFVDQNFKYDGLEHEILVTCKGQEIENLKIYYINNIRSERGNQVAEAIFTINGKVVGRRKATISISDVSMNKTVYNYGESIYITAHSILPLDWIGIYNKNAVVGEDDSILWYYIIDSSKGLLDNNTNVLSEVAENNNPGSYLNNILLPGEYKLVLLSNGGYEILQEIYFVVLNEGEQSGSIDLSSIQFKSSDFLYDSTEHSLTATYDSLPDGISLEYENNTRIELGSQLAKMSILYNGEVIETRYATINIIKSNSETIITDKKEYMLGETILVSGIGTGTDWIGLYRADDIIPDTPSIYWFDFTNHISGGFYDIKKEIPNESRDDWNEVKDLPAGKYVVILFSQGGYTEVARTEFEILDQEIEGTAPEGASFLSYKPLANNGFAEGEIVVEGPVSGAMATGVNIYWANSNKILGDYTAIGNYSFTESVIKISLPINVIIPSTATQICAITYNNFGISKTPTFIDIPTDYRINVDDSYVSELTIVSDVHITVQETDEYNKLNNEHFSMMLNDAVSRKNNDGIFINGDIADTGNEAEYQKMFEIVNETANFSKNIYLGLGNHDLYDGSTHNPGDYKTQIELFKKYAGVQSPYYSLTFQNYKVIFLANEVADPVRATLSPTQLSWLDSEISSFDSNKPIFILLHQSISNTVSGSLTGQGWDGLNNPNDLINVIKKYDNIIMFNGHSHWTMDSTANMHNKSKDLPYIFNTASVAYLWEDTKVQTGQYLEGSQGYYVRIYEDKIILLGRDFANKRYISNAIYKINL